MSVFSRIMEKVSRGYFHMTKPTAAVHSHASKVSETYSRTIEPTKHLQTFKWRNWRPTEEDRKQMTVITLSYKEAEELTSENLMRYIEKANETYRKQKGDLGKS